ncbi:Rhs family protein [Methylocaldum marinum]|uniref:Rhs family protein n=2 Tax=Methylocaldum marinum TaxID=1432792 RepID=A0A250KTD5_9GAMM|nr:Rhs family protein [Methylocaldum marinum]
MAKAARLNDPIGHSPSMNWLVKGLLIGGAIAVAGVAIAGTGGLAAAAIVGGAAAGGAGIGELMSTMSWAPKEIAGAIVGAGSGNVYINGRPAVRAHLDKVACDKHSGTPPIATGSSKVFINGLPAARVGDKTGCGGDITEGSGNVFIGGGTLQTDVIHPEDLVPGWVHATLFVVGAAAAVVLAGPVVATLGLVGGLAGGAGGGWFGGRVWGEGSDGQKWAMLGGSLISGALGTKGGVWFNRNYEITSFGVGSNLGNINITSRSTPLKTTPLQPFYVGEEIPGNPKAWTSGRGPVRYLSGIDREACRLHVKDGKLYDNAGNPFDTSDAKTWDGQPKAIYIMDKEGKLFASMEQKPFDFHHSSLDIIGNHLS